MNGQPDVLIHCLPQDIRGVSAHETGLVFQNDKLVSVIGRAGHLVVTIEVAFEIVLAAVRLAADCAFEFCTDVFNGVRYGGVFVIGFVRCKHRSKGQDGSIGCCSRSCGTCLGRQPDVLLNGLLQDRGVAAAHKAGLVFQNSKLAAVIGRAGHLVVAVEVALEIVLAAVGLAADRAGQIRTDIFDGIGNRGVFVIGLVRCKDRCEGQDGGIHCSRCSRCLGRQPDVLLNGFLKDRGIAAAHKAGLVFQNDKLVSVIGRAGHLVVAVEVAFDIILTAIGLAADRAGKFRTDVFNGVGHSGELIIGFVRCKHRSERQSRVIDRGFLRSFRCRHSGLEFCFGGLHRFGDLLVHIRLGKHAGHLALQPARAALCIVELGFKGCLGAGSLRRHRCQLLSQTGSLIVENAGAGNGSRKENSQSSRQNPSDLLSACSCLSCQHGRICFRFDHRKEGCNQTDNQGNDDQRQIDNPGDNRFHTVKSGHDITDLVDHQFRSPYCSRCQKHGNADRNVV